MSEINIPRAGLIDGLPLSYNTSYIIKNKKICEVCKKLFKQKNIDRNDIVCSEEFEFFHKTCLMKNGISYTHQKLNDKSSVVKLNKVINTFNSEI